MPQIKFPQTWTKLIAASTLYLVLTARVSAIGIGFSLTLDYGVASVRFWNDTSVDAAIIPGNQAYKDMMRSLDIRGSIVNEHAQLPGVSCKDCCILRDPSPQPALSPLVCSIWEEPLKDMLGALRDSVAIYLPSSTTFTVVIAVPFPTCDLFDTTLETISSSLSLNLLYQLPASAVVAMNVEDPSCREVQLYPEAMHDGYEMILAVDYTQAALTAMVLTGMCNAYHVERVLHETSFGADNMSKDVGRSRVALKHALQQLTALPVKCRFDRTEFESIQKVVLFGDAHNHTQLHQALCDVLNRRLHYQFLGPGALWDSLFSSGFDVARYAARSCARSVHRSASGIRIH